MRITCVLGSTSRHMERKVSGHKGVVTIKRTGHAGEVILLSMANGWVWHGNKFWVIIEWKRGVTTERSGCAGQVILYLAKCRSRLFVFVTGGTTEQRRIQRRRYFRCTRWPNSPPDGSAPKICQDKIHMQRKAKHFLLIRTFC